MLMERINIKVQEDQNTVLTDVDGIEKSIDKKLYDINIKTVLDLLEADEESLFEIKGVNSDMIEQIYSSVQNFIEREDIGDVEEDFEGSTEEE